MIDFFTQEGVVKDLQDILDIVEGEACDVHGVDFLDVLAVVLAQEDVGDAGALGGEDLLLDTAHGEHLAAERDLAGHGDALADLTLCEG